MRAIRIAALGILTAVSVISLGADILTPHDYSIQFRESPNERPSKAFPLGTDEVGRDRLSRLLHATRTSILCAPVAALAATAIAAIIGIVAGYLGGWTDAGARAITDMVLSLPWLFAVLTVRALLPLNISPWASLIATYALLATIGWAPGVRVVRASVTSMRASSPILHAHACGSGNLRILFVHILPNLRPVLSAQFWILVPVFLLTEANLGLLGLGITEPIPSWGNMLAELQDFHKIVDAPWVLAPAFLLVLVLTSLQFVVSGSAIWE